ncbi:MAG: aldehyde dehydrogenase family protein [Nocardioides sp.]
MNEASSRSHMVIDGRACPAEASEWFEVYNPATGQVLAEVPRGRAVDIAAATMAAQNAFPAWRDASPSIRARALYELADLLEAELEDLAKLLSRETGNALRTQARPEMASTVSILRYFAGVAGEMKGETVPLATNLLNFTVRAPLGVVGAMTPWNAPAQLAVVKAAAAIVMGNTFVLKASEEAPLTVLRIATLAQRVLPPGVFSVVTGMGPEAGAALLTDPHVNKLSFTGSTRVGRLVMAAAAERIVPVSLELGGKSPAVVLADSDDDATAAGVLNGMRFHRQGQSCTAGSRLYVHSSIYDNFIARLKSHLEELVVGDPMDEATDMGSLINGTQFERVREYVRRAIADGAELIAGDDPADALEGPGYYLRPVLLGQVPQDHPAACEEIFGPVMVVDRWSDVDELVDRCNDSPYGLAAYVWAHDITHALNIARRLEAGWVQINRGLGQLPGMSYGGIKASGIGGEFSLETALDAFTQRKTVTVAL